MTLVLTANVRCDVCRVRSGPEVVVEQQPGEPMQWDEADRLAHAEARREGWYVDAAESVCPGCRYGERR